jgi:hypothetical protein
MADANRTLLIILTRTYTPCDADKDEFVEDWGQLAWEDGDVGAAVQGNPQPRRYHYQPLDGTTAHLLLVHGCRETVYDKDGFSVEEAKKQIEAAIENEKDMGLSLDDSWDFLLCTHGPVTDEREKLAKAIEGTLPIMRRSDPIDYTSGGKGLASQDLMDRIGDQSWRSALEKLLSETKHLVNRAHLLRDELLCLRFDLWTAASEKADVSLRDDARKGVVGALNRSKLLLGVEAIRHLRGWNDSKVYGLFASGQRKTKDWTFQEAWGRLLNLSKKLDSWEDASTQKLVERAFQDLPEKLPAFDRDLQRLARSTESLLVAIQQSSGTK